MKNEQLGTIAGAATWGSCSYQEGTPDMFFYGIHGIEPLFVLMGTGCETVTRVQTKDTDLVTGVWKDGRVGTYRGIRRNKADFGAVAFGSKAIVPAGKGGGYEELCHEIGRFFKTGKPPVSPEETIEIFAFMEAADESKRQGGCAGVAGQRAGQSESRSRREVGRMIKDAGGSRTHFKPLCRRLPRRLAPASFVE